MPNIVTLKTKNICEAIGIGRHQLRAWTDVLPPYVYRQTSERSARHFDPVDLLFFAVVNHITTGLGLSLKFLRGVSAELYTRLSEPHSMTSGAYILMTETEVRFFDVSSERIESEGAIIDIRPAQEITRRYLGVSNQQPQLNLGLVKIG